jgi:hypothetical protein
MCGLLVPISWFFVDAPAGLSENVDCSVKVAPRQKFLPLVDGFLLKAADKWFDSLITWL